MDTGIYMMEKDSQSFKFVYDYCVVSGYRSHHSGTILNLNLIIMNGEEVT